MQIMSKVTTNLTCSKLEYDKLDKKCTCTEFKIFFSSSLVKFSAQSSHQENKKKIKITYLIIWTILYGIETLQHLLSFLTLGTLKPQFTVVAKIDRIKQGFHLTHLSHGNF